MDMFAKLKSTVGQYLPGNPLSKEYEISSQHTASFGPGLYWKVFRAISYSTKKEASVFFFEKRQLEQFASKVDRDYVLEVLKKGVQQLTKLRHPRILAVYHPLEETTSALAFATEPILCSLANKVRFPLDHSIPDEAIEIFLKSPLHEIDIKFGFFQLCEALSFLHGDAKIVHGNLCPESIVLTTSGDWKLAGFDFAITATQASAGVGAPTWNKFSWQTNIPPIAQPNLAYFAPENRSRSAMAVSSASDMFSVGCLFHAVHNGGRPMFDICHDRHHNIYAKWDEWVERYIKNQKWNGILKVPKEVFNHVAMLLSEDPSIRPDADQVLKLPFFQDVAVQTLQYLDTLVQRDLMQRSQFFRGLPKVVEKLPKHINLNRVLPPLFREFSNADMVPFLLPPILAIAESCSQEEYSKYVFVGVSPAFKMVRPIQIPLILLQHMNMLLSKTSPNDVKNYVLPMAYMALETGNESVQELCLSTLPAVSSLIDYGTLKSAILPRIKKLALETNQVAIKVKCMVCMAKLLECMDKWFVLDHILPFLPQVKSSEPAVISTMLGIYKVALTDKKLGITKEAIVSHCLPFLLQMCLETTLNLEQFEVLMSVIRQMLEQVEGEQRTKLQQLALLRDQHATLTNSMNEVVYDTSSSVSQSVRSSASSQNVATGFLLPSSMAVSSSSGNLKLGNESKTRLSLEEKERLAAAKQQQVRMKSEPAPKAIQTSNVSQPMKVSKPKDLTSSLIERELASMSVLNSSSGFSTPNYQPFANPGSTQKLTPGFSAMTSVNWSNGSNSQLGSLGSIGSFSSNSPVPTNTNAFPSSFPPPPQGSQPVNNMNSNKGNKDLFDLLG